MKTNESSVQIQSQGLSNISQIIHLKQNNLSAGIQTLNYQTNHCNTKVDPIQYLNQQPQCNLTQSQQKQLVSKINNFDKQLDHQASKNLLDKKQWFSFFKSNLILFFSFIIVFIAFCGLQMNGMITLPIFPNQLLLMQFKSDNSPHHKCPEHLITYIWVGRAQIPSKYLEMIKNCPNTTEILGNKQFDQYIAMWNQAEPNYIINLAKYKLQPIAKADLFRKVYLYFQSGIYSDFDTILNEQCYKNVISDEIVFTNSWSFDQYNIYIPEQNFFMVRQKYNSHLKRWIISHIREVQDGIGNRWEQCEHRQCVILFCQHHRYDKSYWSKQYIDKLKE